MSEDQLQELLREMRDEAVPPDSVARLRSRVAHGTSRRAFNVWRVPALGLLAAAVVLVTLLFPQAKAPLPPPSPATALPSLGVRAPEARPFAAAVRHRVGVVHRVKRPVRRASSVAVQIRIETDDPEIVILLTGE